MKLIKSTLSEITSRDSYWAEILKRDEPRKKDCCEDELQSLVSSMDSRDLMLLLHLGAKSIEKHETINQ